MVELDLGEMDECCFIIVQEHARLAILRSYRKHNQKVTCILKLALFLVFCKGLVGQLQEFLCIINVQTLSWDIILAYFKIPEVYSIEASKLESRKNYHSHVTVFGGGE